MRNFELPLYCALFAIASCILVITFAFVTAGDYQRDARAARVELRELRGRVKNHLNAEGRGNDADALQAFGILRPTE